MASDGTSANEPGEGGSLAATSPSQDSALLSSPDCPSDKGDDGDQNVKPTPMLTSPSLSIGIRAPIPSRSAVQKASVLQLGRRAPAPRRQPNEQQPAALPQTAPGDDVARAETEPSVSASCIRGCCNSDDAAPPRGEQESDGAASFSSSCTRGCCSKDAPTLEKEKRDGTASVSCTRGCCSKDELQRPAIASPSSSAPEFPSEGPAPPATPSLRETACARGCCSKTASAAAAATAADAAVRSSPSCARGCCDADNDPAIESEAAAPSAEPLATSGEKTDGCDCCKAAGKEEAKRGKRRLPARERLGGISSGGSSVDAEERSDKCCSACSDCVEVEEESAGEGANKAAADGREECCGGCKVNSGEESLSAEKAASKGAQAGGQMGDVTMICNVQGMDCASCGTELSIHARKLEGLNAISVSTLTNIAQVSFDPTKLTVDRVLRHLNGLKFSVTERAASLEFLLTADPLISGVDAKPWLEAQRGVCAVSNGPAANQFLVAYDPALLGVRDLAQSFAAKFPAPVPPLASEPPALNDGKEAVQDLKRRFIVSIAFAIPILFSAFILPLISTWNAALMQPVFRALPLKFLLEFLLCTPVQTWVAWPVYKAGFIALIKVRRANMDTLVALSTSVAYFFSVGIMFGIIATNNFAADAIFNEIFFSASAIVLCLVLLGRYLDVYLRRSAGNVQSSLAELQGRTAFLLDSKGEGSRVPRILIQRGDEIKVLPGERFPTDGRVLRGTSHADEATFSGESTPVKKSAGGSVYSGTLNIDGMLVIEATRVPGETQVDVMAAELAKAQLSKAKIESLVDRISNVFVWSIIALAFAVVALWLALSFTNSIHLPSNSSPVSFSIKFGLTLLIVACPCALGLATPTAVLVGAGVAARHSILLKRGSVMELMSRIRVVCFDKTGTLTSGHLDIVTAALVPKSKLKSEAELFYFAASAELGSEHPIAAALVAHETEHRAPKGLVPKEPREHKVIPGRGVSALVGKRPVLVKRDIKDHQSKGRTVVLVAVDSALAGLIALADSPRPHAKEIVAWLSRKGKDVWMISGDNRRTCRFIAEQVGISPDRIVADAKPLRKASVIRELRETSGDILFIGDGINDSLVLAEADVAVAMGGGAQLSAEVADLILVSEDLRSLPIAIDLCQTIYRRIKVNLGWAFIYNCILIPIAAGILFYPADLVIPPAFAGLSELLSTVPIFLISLHLRRYHPPAP